ncbi:IS3 family transposase [Thalassobius sp. MITS945101]
MTDGIIGLVDLFGRYGYRMVPGLLSKTGWRVGHERVERIGRRKGLKV